MAWTRGWKRERNKCMYSFRNKFLGRPRSGLSWLDLVCFSLLLLLSFYLHHYRYVVLFNDCVSVMLVSSSPSVFPFQHHSTNAPFLYFIRLTPTLYTRGGPLVEFRQTHHMRKLELQPFINETKRFCLIWWRLISVHQTKIGYFHSVIILVSSYNHPKHRSISARWACKLAEYYFLQATWREPHCGQPCSVTERR
jgi:hypothetical protein